MANVLAPLNIATLAPLLILVCTAAGILLFERWRAPWQFSAWIALTSLAVAIALTLIANASGQGGPVQDALGGDGIAVLFTLLLCGATGAAILIGIGSGSVCDGGGYALVLLVVSGAWVVAQATHLMPLAIGLALLYVTSSALLGPRAAWRYTIAQGAGLACFLLGIALIYGTSGSMRTHAVAESLRRQVDTGVPNSLVSLGLGLIIGGLGLPLGTVPFHPWLSAVYREAQLLGRLLVSLILPAAALAALSRLDIARSERIRDLLIVTGLLGAVLGHWRALRSRRITDTMTGVQIAQSGILALVLIPASAAEWRPLFYMLGSHTLNLIVLWATTAIDHGEDSPMGLSSLEGLGQRAPWLAAAMTLCLLNLAGMLPLAGMVGQLYLFRAIFAAGRAWPIAVIIVGNLMAWLWVARWLIAMWMRDPQDSARIEPSPEIAVVALSAASCTLLAGLYFETIVDWIARLTGG